MQRTRSSLNNTFRCRSKHPSVFSYIQPLITGIKTHTAPRRLRPQGFQRLFFLCFLLFILSPSPALAESKNDIKFRAKRAAQVFRAVVSEWSTLAEPVLRQMPVGLVDREEKWSSGVQIAWQTFFGSTLIHTGQEGSNRPIIAYYNPFSDTLVISVWEFSKTKQPQVAEICALPGESLRSPTSSSSRAPAWLVAKDLFGDLAATSSATMRKLEEMFPAKAATIKSLPAGLCTSDRQKRAEVRLFDLATGIAEFVKSQASDPLSALIKTAGQGEAVVIKAFPELSKPEVQLVTSLGHNLAAFTPAIALAMPADSGYLIVLADPASAQRLIQVHLSRRSDQFRVSRVSPIRLAAQGAKG